VIHTEFSQEVNNATKIMKISFLAVPASQRARLTLIVNHDSKQHSVAHNIIRQYLTICLLTKLAAECSQSSYHCLWTEWQCSVGLYNYAQNLLWYHKCKAKFWIQADAVATSSKSQI